MYVQLRRRHTSFPVSLSAESWSPSSINGSFRVASAKGNSESKQCCIPGGTAEISAPTEDLKDAGVVIPTTSPFNPAWPVQKRDGSWRMTKNQVVTPMTAAVPDVVSFLKQVSTCPGPTEAMLSVCKAGSTPLV